MNPSILPSTSGDLTPEQVAMVYTRLKAAFVPPSEEEMHRLVEESTFSLAELVKELDALEQPSRPS